MRQVAQSVERETLEVEVQGSTPGLGTGGRVRSHLTSPIRRDVRFWMTKTLDTDTDNRQLTTARFWISEPWKIENHRISHKKLRMYSSYTDNTSWNPSNKNTTTVPEKHEVKSLFFTDDGGIYIYAKDPTQLRIALRHFTCNFKAFQRFMRFFCP